MLKRICLTAIPPLAIGALLGYVAAGGKLGLSRQVSAAAAPERQVTLRSSAPGALGTRQASCWSDGASKVQLIALARAKPVSSGAQIQNEGKKPNILVIFGDDVGQSNISAYTHGLMGYHTPNIDRIAKEGTLFTDYYAEQSCTAGRSSFITGQCTYSRNSGHRGPCVSGPSRSPSFVWSSCSTCGLIRTNERTSLPTPTTTG
jgi:arylsulfatase